MVTVRDPKADPDADGYSDAAVDVNGELVPIENGTFTAPRSWVDGYAEREGVAVEDVLADGDDDADNEPGTCDTVKSDGEVCGRDLPCPYHSED